MLSPALQTSRYAALPISRARPREVAFTAPVAKKIRKGRKRRLRVSATLEAHRLAVIPAVAGAQALAGLGIKGDALAIAPEVFHLNRVPFGTQYRKGIGRQ